MIELVEGLTIAVHAFMIGALLVFTALYIVSRTKEESRDIQEVYLIGIVVFGAILSMFLVVAVFS